MQYLVKLGLLRQGDPTGGLPDVVQEESELEAVMKAADLDGDGTLNYEVIPRPLP